MEEAPEQSRQPVAVALQHSNADVGVRLVDGEEPAVAGTGLRRIEDVHESVEAGRVVHVGAPGQAHLSPVPIVEQGTSHHRAPAVSSDHQPGLVSRRPAADRRG